MTQLALYEMPKKECRRVAISVPIPKWLPPSLALWLRQRMAERPEGKLTVATRFSKGERAAMKRRRPVPISAWAEKHRILEMSAIRGRWRNVFTPYLTGIMDVSGLPGVETVIICKSPQTGGSECGHNIVGYCIDRLPGPVMYVFPDELTARENAKDRIIPMIEASPRLRQYMTGYGDDASSLRINLLHMPIYLGWSGSVSRLGNKPIRILILDELDKYKNPKNEASSESLAEKRTTTWRTRRKVVKISTPTTDDGPIWKALTEEAGARFDFWVRCPHCGFFQHMDFLQRREVVRRAGRHEPALLGFAIAVGPDDVPEIVLLRVHRGQKDGYPLFSVHRAGNLPAWAVVAQGEDGVFRAGRVRLHPRLGGVLVPEVLEVVQFSALLIFEPGVGHFGQAHEV